MGAERERKITERAYHLWVEGGRQHGKADEHWHQATLEIDAAKERKGADRKAAKAATPDAKAADKSKKTAKPKSKKKDAGGSGNDATVKAKAKKASTKTAPTSAAAKPAAPSRSRPDAAPRASRANGAARTATNSSGGPAA